jgi:hypothetical protein
VVDSDVFTLPHSDLNDFLFAQIGVEAGGLELSVMSALAREGVDPWQEGTRLSRLPSAGAIDELGRLIAAMPAGLWPQPIATEIAARLVRLLPRRETRPSVVVEKMGAAGLFGTPRTANPGINRQWLTLILLGLAVLAGSAVELSRAVPDMRDGASEMPPIAPSTSQPPAPPSED